MKSRKKEKEKKLKTPFYQDWYIDGRSRSFKEVVTSKLVIAIIPVFIVIAYAATIIIIGNGAYGYDESSYGALERLINEYVVPGAGIDTLAIRESAELTLNDRSNKPRQLVINKKNGYFNAKITVDLTEDYGVNGKHRNYNSQTEYIQWYWVVFGISIFVGGPILWLFSMSILYFILTLVAYNSKRKADKAQPVTT